MGNLNNNAKFMLNLLFKKYEHSWELFARVVLLPSLIIFSIGFVIGIASSGLGLIADPPLYAIFLVLFIFAAIAVFLGLPVLVTIYGVLTRDERPLIPILLLEVSLLHPLFLTIELTGANFSALFSGEYWRLFTEFKTLSMLAIVVTFFFIKKFIPSSKSMVENYWRDKITVIVLLSLILFYFTGGVIAKPFITLTASNPEGTIYYTIDHTSNLYAIDDDGSRLISDDLPCSIESKYTIMGISPKGRYLICTNTALYQHGIIIYDIKMRETKKYDDISLEGRFYYGSNQLLWSPDEKKVVFTHPSVGYLEVNSGKMTVVGDSTRQIAPSFDSQGNFYYLKFTKYGPGKGVVIINNAELYRYREGNHEKIHSFTTEDFGELPYSFSLDGKKLLYYTGPLGGYKIMKFDLTAKEERVVTEKDPELEYDLNLHVFYYSRHVTDLNDFERSFYHYRGERFFFSPTFTWVAGRTKAGLSILNLETGERKQLTSGRKSGKNEGIIGWI